MPIILSHISAWEALYWLRTSPYPSFAPTMLKKSDIEMPTRYRVDQVRCSNVGISSGRLHVLAGLQEQRRRLVEVSVHRWPSSSNELEVIMLNPNIGCVMPLCCARELILQLPFGQRLQLAMEGCGKYALDPFGDSQSFVAASQLFSVEEAAAYADSLYGVRGASELRRLSRLMCGNAASPAESKLYLLLCLPFKYGGYGFPKPSINHRIDYSVDLAGAKGSGHYVCDFYWPESQIAIEYDSDAFHMGMRSFAYDAKRRNVLASMGITVLTATREHLNDETALRALVNELARLMGRRLRIPNDFGSAHRRLFHELHPSKTWLQAFR